MATGLKIAVVALLVGFSNADRGSWGGGGGGGGYWSGGRWGNGSGGRDGDDNSNFGNEENGFGFGSVESFDRANAILIAHGVLASAVWVLFVPWAAILLRLGIKNPVVLKLHAILQILSLLIFIVAAGLGVWLAQSMSDFGVWEDSHPRLGLLVLALAILQPVFGFLHHRLFKKRSAAAAAGTATKAPGRTIPGYIHLWLGRSLIVLAIITGGLGIRLTSFSPFRTDNQSRISGIVYGVVAGIMFALYVVIVVLFEIRRKRAASSSAAQDMPMKSANLPSYQESQSSATSVSSRQHTGAQGATTANSGVRYS